MEFTEGIMNLAEKAAKERKKKVITEESTKMALVVPMIKLLGYDVFDTNEVCPEFNAAYGRHRDARVDYAILQDGKPAIIIECKPCNEANLEKYDSQLFGYYVATSAKFGILTNGIDYRFYSDLDETNKMDEEPFLSFSLDSITANQIAELKQFSKDSFDRERIASSAEGMKYQNRIAEYLRGQIEDMDDGFVGFILRETRAYSGKAITKNVISQSKPTISAALKSVISAEVNKRISQALNGDTEPDESPEEHTESRIVTTAEEIESFYIVRGILAVAVPVSDITYRDAETYFSILYQSNSRKPICRLYLTPTKKQIRIYNGSADSLGRKEFDQFDLQSLDDIYSHRDALILAVRFYAK